MYVEILPQHLNTHFALTLIFIVRDTVAVKCFECEAYAIEDQCYLDDLDEYDCPADADGCWTYRITYEGKNIFQSGARLCFLKKHLDCIRTHTGLDMMDGRCLKTNLERSTHKLMLV